MSAAALLPATHPADALAAHGMAGTPVPGAIAAAGDRAALRFLEFFTAAIRNLHTRRAYGRAVTDFLAWCEDRGVPALTAVQPMFSHP